MGASTRTPAQVRDELSVAFRDFWAATTPIVWDNTAGESGTEFVRFSLRHNIGTQAALDGFATRMFRRTGTAFVQIFVPLKRGTKRGDDLAEKALEFFESYNGPIRLQDPGANEAGEDQGWRQINVAATFQYDSVRSVS